MCNWRKLFFFFFFGFHPTSSVLRDFCLQGAKKQALQITTAVDLQLKEQDFCCPHPASLILRASCSRSQGTGTANYRNCYEQMHRSGKEAARQASWCQFCCGLPQRFTHTHTSHSSQATAVWQCSGPLTPNLKHAASALSAISVLLFISIISQQIRYWTSGWYLVVSEVKKTTTSCKIIFCTRSGKIIGLKYIIQLRMLFLHHFTEMATLVARTSLLFVSQLYMMWPQWVVDTMLLINLYVAFSCHQCCEVFVFISPHISWHKHDTDNIHNLQSICRKRNKKPLSVIVSALVKKKNNDKKNRVFNLKLDGYLSMSSS